MVFQKRAPLVCEPKRSGTVVEGDVFVRNETFLQCDICERYACADCLQVYDIFSGYDFLCHECARTFEPPPPGTRGH